MEKKIKKNLFDIWTLAFSIFIVSSCSYRKLEISKEGDLHDAINFAVSEYSDSASKRNDEKSVFFVNIQEINNHIYSFSISPSPTTIYYNEKYLKNSDVEGLPTNYLIVNNQLYYWREDGSKGSRNSIEVFKKYDFLKEDKEAYGMYVNSIINDDKKLTYYYFCRNDLREYAKVYSSKNRDYFKIPTSLKCE